MAAELEKPAPIPGWHRRLLISAAVTTTLLIAMGGILCVTQSIRDCPDWPGCFGRIIPPLQTGPILEYTHRVLAALSGLLILSAAIAGMTRRPRSHWVVLPPLVAVLLLIEVSYFGAQVVLHGLAPGWAALDVGSALLVVSLMVAAAVAATDARFRVSLAKRMAIKTLLSRLVLAAFLVVYAMLVSGIFVAGPGSISACLGWPLCSPQLIQQDGHLTGSILRLILGVAAVLLILASFILTRRERSSLPGVYSTAAWLAALVSLELLVQVSILILGHLMLLLVLYTVVAALIWALLSAFLVQSTLER